MCVCGVSANQGWSLRAAVESSPCSGEHQNNRENVLGAGCLAAAWRLYALVEQSSSLPQAPPPSDPSALCSLLGADRFLPRHSGDLEVKPISQVLLSLGRCHLCGGQGL